MGKQFSFNLISDIVVVSVELNGEDGDITKCKTEAIEAARMWLIENGYSFLLLEDAMLVNHNTVEVTFSR